CRRLPRDQAGAADHAPRHGAGAGGCRPRAGSHWLRQRPWHRHRTGRYRRDPGDPGTVRLAYADQLAEELSRSYAGCLWRARVLVQHRDDESGPLYPYAEPRRHRPTLWRPGLPDRRTTDDAAPIRDEQQFRLRWDQYFPDLPPLVLTGS